MFKLTIQALIKSSCCKNKRECIQVFWTYSQVQSHPVVMDTEGTIKSDRILCK